MPVERFGIRSDNLLSLDDKRIEQIRDCRHDLTLSIQTRYNIMAEGCHKCGMLARELDVIDRGWRRRIADPVEDLMPVPIKHLSTAGRKTIEQMFCHGPVWDGDLISKHTRDELAANGYIERSDGFQWLTAKGVAIATSTETRVWLSRNGATYPLWREKLRHC